MQYQSSRYAQDIHCPKCQMPYDDNNNNGGGTNLRLPVKLIPCSHTCCRPCVRNYFNQQQQEGGSNTNNQPQCPLCNATIEVTQFDEAALTLVRSAQIEMMAQYQQQNNNSNNNYNGVDGNYYGSYSHTSSSSATLGPLNPRMREEILAKCTRSEDAPRAEQVARAIGSLKRSIDFAKTEFDAAKEEKDAANQNSETKSTVVSTLQTELKGLDERIKQMNLDRQVILHQLQNAIAEESNSVKYRTECEMRVLDIQRKIQAEATELENRVSVIQQLAPGVNLY